MNLLLLSNSTNANEKYLEFTLPFIKDFLVGKVKKALFIPYAAVSFSFDEYLEMVKEQLATIDVDVESIHDAPSEKEAIENAECIIVGGGNTFHLTMLLQQKGLYDVLRNKVQNGTPYIGWSAGSNMASPTIKTTNDMPIVEPESFEALGFLPFQINPHYIDKKMQGHAGESRDDRILEFVTANKKMRVVGLREGTALLVAEKKIELVGEKPLKVFEFQKKPFELENGSDFSFLWR